MSEAKPQAAADPKPPTTEVGLLMITIFGTIFVIALFIWDGMKSESASSTNATSSTATAVDPDATEEPDVPAITTAPGDETAVDVTAESDKDEADSNTTE